MSDESPTSVESGPRRMLFEYISDDGKVYIPSNQIVYVLAVIDSNFVVVKVVDSMNNEHTAVVGDEIRVPASYVDFNNDIYST